MYGTRTGTFCLFLLVAGGHPESPWGPGSPGPAYIGTSYLAWTQLGPPHRHSLRINAAPPAHGIVRCPLGLNNARFTHRTNIAYFLEPEMQMSLHQTFLFCLLIDVPWWKRVFIWFLSMGFNLYCAFTVLSFPRGRTYGNTQNHRKSSFSSVLGS